MYVYNTYFIADKNGIIDEIYTRDAAHLQQSTASLRVSVTYTIYTRIYFIFLSNYTCPADTRFSFNFSRTRAQDDLVVFFSNTLLSAAAAASDLYTYTFVFEYKYI